jgi:hypothetical protein
MSDSSRHERLVELLADRALVGLAPEEAAELATLLAEFPNEDADAFDRAAAAVQLAHMEKLEPLPEHLRSRLEPQKKLRPIEPTTDRLRFAGWIAAAASLAIAVTSWIARPTEIRVVETVPSASSTTAIASPTTSAGPPPVAPKLSLADLRVELAANPSAVNIPWSATKDPGASGASGDVVFSVAEQRGFMRFHGLAANDPKQRQYQLWIFDKAQDQRYPIDGGVFDIDSTTGDVIVQIQPKIRVIDPTLFAVTIENPGGVVVSKREHIVVTAAKI